MKTKTLLPTKYFKALATVAEYLDDGLGYPPPSEVNDAMLESLEDLDWLGSEGTDAAITAEGRRILAALADSE